MQLLTELKDLWCRLSDDCPVGWLETLHHGFKSAAEMLDSLVGVENGVNFMVAGGLE